MSKVSFVSSTLATLLTLSFVVKGQQPSPTPSPRPSSGTSAESRNDSSVDQKSEPTPTPSPELDFWHQETMTGDWGGTRARWRERGVEMQFTLTGFVQGTAAGGLRQDTEGNGKFEAEFNIDLEKL